MALFLQTPFWGIFLSIVTFVFGQFLFKKSKGFFLFQPLFVVMVLGVIILLIVSRLAHITPAQSYANYKLGGDIIFWFLNPATVAFAVPLYKRRDILHKYWMQIFLSLIIGMVISLLLIFGISKVLGLSQTSLGAMLPQAATTAIAIQISANIVGGQAGVTAAAITAMTAILNAVLIMALGDKLVKWFKLENNPIGIGLGFGTAGHTIGSAKAMEYGSVQGAMAAISVVVVGLVVDIVVPIFAKFIGF
ncbi:LrgB family protein [Periweissella fabalis]|uniref:Antiholin LrgB n=1 Tax=Periweissella fabalis TaxID=1070421 RepID=A0A7X6N1C3_9LACO|nr:LrgB family protein [Periweissella fabalis]MCM0598985.1 LrgB family protein [Periweissella fabalis]NKZ23265.1 antiholin LrgB [Periweissella fabalis]